MIEKYYAFTDWIMYMHGWDMTPSRDEENLFEDILNFIIRSAKRDDVANCLVFPMTAFALDKESTPNFWRGYNDMYEVEDAISEMESSGILRKEGDKLLLSPDWFGVAELSLIDNVRINTVINDKRVTEISFTYTDREPYYSVINR